MSNSQDESLPNHMKKTNTIFAKLMQQYKESKEKKNPWKRDSVDSDQALQEAAAQITDEKIVPPGCLAVYFSKPTKSHRMLWLFIIVFCTVLLVVQMREYILKLQMPPVSTETRVLFNDSLLYPAVTVCHHHGFKKSVVQSHQMRGEVGELTNAWKSFPWNKTSLDEFWKKASFCGNETFFACTFGSVDNPAFRCGKNHQPKDNVALKEVFSRGRGRCFTVSPAAHARPPAGKMMGYHFVLQYTAEEYYNVEDALWDVYVHPAEEAFSEHMILAGGVQEHLEIRPGEELSFKLSVAEFYTLDHVEYRCQDQAHFSAVQCMKDCMEKMLQPIGCRSPWSSIISKGLPECKSYKEFKKLYIGEDDLLEYEVGVCRERCPRPCFSRHFSAFIVNRVNRTDLKENNLGSIYLYYPSGIVKQVKQRWAYDVSQFIGEMGGSMGLLLGVSVLSIIEIFQTSVKYVLTKWEKK